MKSKNNLIPLRDQSKDKSRKLKLNRQSVNTKSKAD